METLSWPPGQMDRPRGEIHSPDEGDPAAWPRARGAWQPPPHREPDTLADGAGLADSGCTRRSVPPGLQTVTAPSIALRQLTAAAGATNDDDRAMPARRSPRAGDDVRALKAEVTALRATVAALADTVSAQAAQIEQLQVCMSSWLEG